MFELDEKKENNSDEGFYMGSSEIVRWLIKHSGGLIKNGRQAGYFVAIFLVLIFIIIAWLIFLNEKNQSARDAEYRPDTKYEGKQLPDSYR